MTKKILHNFLAKRATFVCKYFKKSVDTVSVHFYTLLLIFQHVIFNKVYLVFQRLQIKKKEFKKVPFYLVVGPLPPPLLLLVVGPLKKKDFFAASPRHLENA